MRKPRLFNFKLRREGGSALLVSLMVMVGLSLLGLGFVAVTETESAIAVNERNSAQALFAAETGARTILEFFQDSTWARDNNLLPQNLNAFKTQRTFPTRAFMNGYYKANAMNLLFDKPFKGADYGNKFFGDGDRNPPTSDVWIAYERAGRPAGENAANTAYLDALNSRLFIPDTASNERVRISDIRVYAPPIPGDQLNANGFWEGTQSRYGVATIRVTAQKLHGNRVVAERSVKTVVAETPFPTVDGAIETSGTLVGQGSFQVFWGKVLSEKGIDLKRAVAGMPWKDAKNPMNYEYGFDSARPRVVGQFYNLGDVVMASAAAQTADPELRKFSYRATGVAATADPAEPAWPKVIGNSAPDGSSGLNWQAMAAVSFPIDADFYHSTDWFYQLIGRTLPDPWLHARARQGIFTMPGNNEPCNDGGSPHPCKYDQPTDPVQTQFSNLFQFQTTTELGDRPNRVEAVFPTMDYEFWKGVAKGGNNENGVYYFRYADGPTGTTNDFIGPGGRRESVYYWLNAATDPATGRPMNGLGAGFYFFDTKNSKNPQFGKGGILTPKIELKSGTVANPFQMQGYIYLNAELFGAAGVGDRAPDDIYPMPGEPFRDVGYRQVIEGALPLKYLIAGGSGSLDTDPRGDFVWVGRNNGVWDFQDVNINGQFDLFLQQRDITRPDGSPATGVWLPVPFFEGCTPGLGGRDATGTLTPGTPAGANCSEPHEPYLNLTYTAAFSGSNPTEGVTVEWYDPSTSGAAVATYRRPKRRTGVNTAAVNPCTAIASPADCTSNFYDADGGLSQLSAILWGAVYSEGGYVGSGQPIYYGALLMRASFEATGTPTVYFNECLARGCLEDQLELQRVTVTSWQTDQ